MLSGLTVGLLLLLAASAAAQTARVSIDVDRRIARVGERMRVTVQIKVSGQMGYSEFIQPAFAGFRLLGTGMSSSNIEIVPFRGIRRHETRVFTVVPLRQGMLNEAPAAVRVAGRLIHSPVVKLKVIAGSAPTPDPVEPGQPVPAPAGRTVFLTGTVSPTKVYLGQQVLATWRLMTRARLAHFKSGSQPTTDDFWSEDLDSPTRLRFEEQMVKGTLYYAAVLARKALFAQKAGTLTIGPMMADVSTVLDHMHSTASTKRKSPPITLEVLPLPRQGKPPGFNQGNVGSYVIAASLDRDTVKGGDAVTLQVVARGRGNLRQLKLPKITKLAGFKVYEPKVTERLQREGGISGEKMVEYLLMPVKSGRLRIRPLVMDTFEPRQGRYRRLTTSPLTLTVTGKVPRSLASRAQAKTNVVRLTIRPPRPASSLSHRPPLRPQRSLLFWILLGLPAVVLLGLVGGEQLRARLTRETPRRQRRAASRRIQGHFKRAREQRRQGHKAAFFGEISAAIRDLLDHKLGLRTEGLTRGELRTQLLEVGFPEDQTDAVIQELENCDFARFAPSASGDEQMDETLGRVKGLLNRLIRTRSVQRAARTPGEVEG